MCAGSASAGLAHPDPDQVVALDHRVAAHAELGGDVVLAGDLDALARGIELQAVVHAADAIAFAAGPATAERRGGSSDPSAPRPCRSRPCRAAPALPAACARSSLPSISSWSQAATYQQFFRNMWDHRTEAGRLGQSPALASVDAAGRPGIFLASRRRWRQASNQAARACPGRPRRIVARRLGLLDFVAARSSF